MQQTGQVYWCRGHVSRKKDSVDAFVDAVMIARLEREDVAQALAGSVGDKARAQEVREQIRKVELRKRRFERDYYEADGEGLSVTEFRRLVQRADAELANLQQEESQLVGTDVAALLGSQAAEGWRTASVHVRQAVVRALCTVTLLHTGRRGPSKRSIFDPQSIVFDWFIK